jgi:hypothetical protein
MSKMEKDYSKFNIVVSGDISINTTQWITEPKEVCGRNWESYSHVHSVSRPGESLLLAKLVAASTNANIISPKLDSTYGTDLGEFLSSIAELEQYPKHTEESKKKVYRVKRFLGFTEPSNGKPRLLKIKNDDENAPLIIIDDENNGFNESPDYWPEGLKNAEMNPTVIYKMNNPLESNPLWKHLEKNHIEKTVIVINSDDLRLKGVNISKSLSWEKTAQDFVWQLNNNPNLSFLMKCKHLVVPFGLEGVIYYRNDDEVDYKLYFLPYAFEGETIRSEFGKIYGLTSAFVSGLARIVMKMNYSNTSFDLAIGEGIRAGIVIANKYYTEGFGTMCKDCPFPNPLIFENYENDYVLKEHVQDVKIPNYIDMDSHLDWYILKDKSSANIAQIAQDIVKSGEREVLKFVPVSKFGKLKSVDRTEIESYRSIKNLMEEYISSKEVPRPLSIAVFGTPGSGKSFGVTEIAKTIAPNKIEKLDFNLSQFRDIENLAEAFHKVRDLVLQKKIPLVFFDEFDSFYEGRLGWLKYLLAPMQDGEFRDGDSVHPIGKAIFVFAGGTSSTYQDFFDDGVDFREAKGPDFVSRLRGYVNILGPNKVKESHDQLFIIRRAVILRALIERKAPHLIDESGKAKIDDGVLRALLKVSRYKHEARSIEAVLEMSMLANAKKWGQSQLPSKEQLMLHVDEDQFLRHLMHDAFYSEKLERIAMAIHHHYRLINKDINPDFLKPWDELDEELKNSSRDQAKHITNALLIIHYDVSYVKEEPTIVKLTEREIDILAEYEHNRWLNHKKETGWSYGEVKDSELKTDPELVEWDMISESVKDKVREMVRIWPDILGECNFAIERLKFSINDYF